MTALRNIHITDKTTGDTAKVNTEGQLHTIIKGTESISNSTATPLLGDGVFTGESENLINVAAVFINIYTDVDSVENGLSIQQSSDGINWDHIDEYTIFANTGKNYNINPNSKWFRIVYTNGTTIQTAFRLQTIFKSVYATPNSHKLGDLIKNDDDSQLIKSVIAVQTNDSNTYANVDIQNPLPSDGDSVYGKDLLIDLSNQGDFIITTEPSATKQRILSCMVSNVEIEKKNDTVNNPKNITLTFARPIITNVFGIDSGPNGDFSNIKITIFQGQASEVIIDESLDNTKYNIRLFDIIPSKFSKMLIQFYTADTITTGLIGIFKSVDVISRLQGQTPDGITKNVQVTNDGDLKISDNSNGLSIAQGNVSGTSFIHKFGKASDFDITDGYVTIWDGANDAILGGGAMSYTYSPSADIDTMSSSDNGDTQIVEIQGLDTDYNVVIQTKTLTGQTDVILTTSLIRVFRLKNIGSTDFAGIVYLRTNGSAQSGGIPSLATTVRAIVNMDNNQTLMSTFTVPVSKTAYLRDSFSAIAGAKKTSVHNVRMFARPFGQVFQLKYDRSIIAVGDSSFDKTYVEPEIFEEKTDIELRVNTDEDQAAISGGFDIVLVDS